MTNKKGNGDGKRRSPAGMTNKKGNGDVNRRSPAGMTNKKGNGDGKHRSPAGMTNKKSGMTKRKPELNPLRGGLAVGLEGGLG